MKKLFTHAGTFHADEVLASAILKLEFGHVSIDRGFSVTDGYDIIYDIGNGKYDHHQNPPMRENGILYASAGLIWKDFGEKAISSFETLSKEGMSYVKEHVDTYLIQGVDALDNGMEVGNQIPLCSISSMVSAMNPMWDEKKTTDEAFHEAVDFVLPILKRTILSGISKYKAIAKVQDAYVKRQNPQVLVLSEFVPWQNALADIDKEGEVLFVVYPSNRGGFNAQAVPVTPDSFESKMPFPESWRGLRDEELAKVSGFPNIVFCHANGFLVATKDFETAFKIAGGIYE